MYRERGYVGLDVVADDPLIGESRRRRVQVWESHVEEVKTLPEGFMLLVRGDDSPLQAIKHAEREMYGVQFHPERADRAHPFGTGLLKRFVVMARSAASPMVAP